MWKNEEQPSEEEPGSLPSQLRLENSARLKFKRSATEARAELEYEVS